MPSAKIVAQKPFGSVIPPLSPGQEAPGGLDAVWLDDGIALDSWMTSARTLVTTPAGQPLFVDPCGIAVLLMVRRYIELHGPIGTPVMRNGSRGGPLAAGSKRLESCPS